MKKKINNLEKILGIKFKNRTFLRQALTHKSFNIKFNNEKLEFLGDRVIGLILSKKLIDLYPEENEGAIDKKFAKLVNKKTCSLIAWQINLQKYILTGSSNKEITQKDEKILSDACEALIGAIYIDQGYDFVKYFVLKLWKKNLERSIVTILDPKTKLQEFSLKKYKKLPVYNLLSSKGPRHNPTFKISVSIRGSKFFVGTGNSKQEAEQNGAEKLLNSININ